MREPAAGRSRASSEPRPQRCAPRLHCGAASVSVCVCVHHCVLKCAPPLQRLWSASLRLCARTRSQKAARKAKLEEQEKLERLVRGKAAAIARKEEKSRAGKEAREKIVAAAQQRTSSIPARPTTAQSTALDREQLRATATRAGAQALAAAQQRIKHEGCTTSSSPRGRSPKARQQSPRLQRGRSPSRSAG